VNILEALEIVAKSFDCAKIEHLSDLYASRGRSRLLYLGMTLRFKPGTYEYVQCLKFVWGLSLS
jgi:hypothetical protein